MVELQVISIMKRLRSKASYIFVISSLSLFSQVDSGFFKITLLHKPDFIQSTERVKYRYSYTNAVTFGIHYPFRWRENGKLKYSFDFGIGYAQFVKNSSSDVIKDGVKAIDTAAPRQDFNFTYAKGFLVYFQYNRPISQVLAWHMGILQMHAGLSKDNLAGKPYCRSNTYSGGGSPGSTVFGAGYYYSDVVNVTTIYSGVCYNIYKNLTISFDIGIDINNDSYPKINNIESSKSHIKGYPYTPLRPYIDHTMPNSPFYSALLRVSYSFNEKRFKKCKPK